MNLALWIQGQPDNDKAQFARQILLRLFGRDSKFSSAASYTDGSHTLFMGTVPIFIEDAITRYSKDPEGRDPLAPIPAPEIITGVSRIAAKLKGMTEQEATAALKSIHHAFSTDQGDLPPFHAANLFANNPAGDLPEIFRLLARTREHLGTDDDQRYSRLLRLMDAARMYGANDITLLKWIAFWQQQGTRGETLDTCVIGNLKLIDNQAKIKAAAAKAESDRMQTGEGFSSPLDRANAAVEAIHQCLRTPHAGLRITPDQGKALCERIMMHATLPES